MSEDKKIPEFSSYDEMADFVDTNDMTDYWEETKPANFEMSPQARRRFLVSVDRNIVLKIQKMARLRGITTESLVNLFLEQHLHELEVQT